MFDLNPLHTPNAALQQWIMLFVAGTLGFIISYISRKELVVQLEDNLASIDRALVDCYQSPPTPPAALPNEDTILQQIRDRSGELDFNRIGRSSAADADDLTAIVGIGPFLEKKLQAIGIYTFRQIANFTEEDVEKVNDIIGFFPGRIERDEWVKQSIKLTQYP